MNIVLLTQKY